MFVLLLIFISYPFLFYKLGSQSLVAWDEAWYAEIAKNIIKTGKFFALHFNGKPYFDHPPFGFWLIALGQKLFGINEIGVRLPSVLFGLMTVICTYYLGKKLFGRLAGFFAGAALISAPWFLSRSRSGNLDIFLTGLYVATIYFALISRENKKYLITFAVVLSLLFLTKTMVPFTILPAILLIFWKPKTIKLSDLYKPLLIFMLIIGFFTFKSYSLYGDLFIKNYLKIGLTGVKTNIDYLESFKLVKTYAHNGIGTWFRSSVLGLMLGLVLLKSKKFLVLFILIISILAPFIFSDKGHIWHMIPIYPFMLLGLFGFVSCFFEKYRLNKFLKIGVMTSIFLILFIPQAKKNWREFIDIPAYISDEAILSREAGKYADDLILDDDFIPTAVYYSDKNVERTVTHLREYFDSDRKFIMIVRDYRLGAENILPSEYEILKKDRDKLLIRKI